MKDILRYMIILLILIGSCDGLFAGLDDNVCYAAVEGNGVVAEHRLDIQQRRHGHRGGDCGRYMSKREFEVLYSKVKDKPFSRDKFELIEVGSLDSRFACYQCRRMMELFSFDDERLEVLELMAPHIVDSENGELLFDALNFENNKEKARKIIKSVKEL